MQHEDCIVCKGGKAPEYPWDKFSLPTCGWDDLLDHDVLQDYYTFGEMCEQDIEGSFYDDNDFDYPEPYDIDDL